MLQAIVNKKKIYVKNHFKHGVCDCNYNLMEGLQQRFYINHIFQAPTFISQEINAKNDYILTLKKGDREPITLEYISKYSLVKSC